MSPTETTQQKPETEPQADVSGGAGGARTVPRESATRNLLTPARFKRILSGAQSGDLAAQSEMFDVMVERDGELGAHLRTRKAGVTSCDWEIEPADDSAEAERAAEYCREVVAGIGADPVQPGRPRRGIEAAMFDLLDAVGKGYAVQEIAWEHSATEWRPAELRYRPQRWFTVADDGETLLIREDAGQTRELNPLNFVVHVARAQSGFLWEAGLLRSCVRPFIVRHFGWKDWLGFAEVYGMPARIGHLSESAAWDSKEARQLYSAVKALGHEYAAVVRGESTIELLEVARGEGRVYQLLLEVADRELVIAILGQVLTSGGEQGGSYALGQVHNQVRLDLVQSDAQALAETLTRQLLTPIVRLNLGPTVPVPQWHIVVEEPEDLQALVKTVKEAVEIGAQVPESWLREKLGYPEPEGDEPVLRIATGGALGLNEANGRRTVPAQPREVVAANQDTVPEVMPEEALEFLGEKRVADQAGWDALSPAGKQRAWWVTGLDQVQTAEAAQMLMGVAEAGASETQFLERLEAAGLSVPGAETPAAGQIAAWKARLVHANNRRGALNAARWMRIRRDQELRPFVEWNCGGAPCPICDPMCGRVLRVDRAAAFAPQVHHYCKCFLTSVSNDEVERAGLEVDEAAAPVDVPAGWQFSRDDAYYLAGRGGAPATAAGREDSKVLDVLPLPGDLI